VKRVASFRLDAVVCREHGPSTVRPGSCRDSTRWVRRVSRLSRDRIFPAEVWWGGICRTAWGSTSRS